MDDRTAFKHELYASGSQLYFRLRKGGCRLCSAIVYRTLFSNLNLYAAILLLLSSALVRRIFQTQPTGPTHTLSLFHANKAQHYASMVTYRKMVRVATTRMRALGPPGTPHTIEGSASIVRTPPRSEQSKGARDDRTTTATVQMHTTDHADHTPHGPHESMTRADSLLMGHSRRFPQKAAGHTSRASITVNGTHIAAKHWDHAAPLSECGKKVEQAAQRRQERSGTSALAH